MAPKCCAKPIFDDADGVTVCTSCGSVISDSQIVAEVTFGETSSGAAMVQGSFVGAGDTHARNTGPFNRFNGKGGSNESREMTLAQGRLNHWFCGSDCCDLVLKFYRSQVGGGFNSWQRPFQSQIRIQKLLRGGSGWP